LLLQPLPFSFQPCYAPDAAHAAAELEWAKRTAPLRAAIVSKARINFFITVSLNKADGFPLKLLQVP
jgi:hypothetical protein